MPDHPPPRALLRCPVLALSLCIPALAAQDMQTSSGYAYTLSR